MTGRIDLPPFPRGWFSVGSSAELGPGAVVPVRYFGRELVLFRTQSGEAHLLDAYCPHLGAHLGHGGEVSGEEIVCPFHGWRFSGDGRCTSMPYGERIPLAAKARSWPLRESGGVLLAWHSESGDAPDWEMPVFEKDNWTDPVSRSWIIRGHTQEVCENTADLGHFRFIHQTHMMKARSQPKVDGPFFSLPMTADPEALVPELRLGSDSALTEGTGYCFGPGLTAADITTQGSDLEAMQRLYVTPIDEEHIELRGVVNVGKLASSDATRAYQEGLSREVFAQWEADVPIWEHKVYRAKPALNDCEAAIATFRRWYSQFYEDRRVESGH
ncbi:MAG: Rieske 2Fe-2S domain-containing protein [Myxococcota bacterium]